MTSTTDTAGHPDVAEISDLTEGLLPPDRSTAVRRHLDACGLCADVETSLEEIRGLLGSMPAPGSMPDDVAARIDAALAAEALLSSTAEGTAEHVSRETSTSRGTPTSADRPAGRPRGGTGPGRSGSERGRRRRVLVLGAVLTAAVLGAGTLVLQSRDGNSTHTTARETSTASADTFSGDSVQNQVRSLLTEQEDPHRGSMRPRAGSDAPSSPNGSTDGPHTFMQTSIPVPGCVRQAISRSDEVLGAKPGSYAGRPAYLVVLSDTHDSKQVTAYVVDATCMRQQPTSAGKVLLTRSVARP